MTDGAARTSDDDIAVFRDAESFLAELGVERRPIVVAPTPEADATAARTGGAPPVPGDPGPLLAGAAADAEVETSPLVDDDDEADGGPPVSATHVRRIVTEEPVDELAAAVSYIRRSTAAQPASEGRLRGRLAERDHDDEVIAAAMERARAERLVDDAALSAALVDEWRALGHAPRRIRQSLRKRGFDESVVDQAVQPLDVQDHTAMAFDLARKRAETLAHLPPETAYRRVVGYVGRRGYGEGLARKAARDAVYDQRSDERTFGR